MSQRDGFASGFFFGAIFGSVVGGILGAVVVSRNDSELEAESEEQLSPNQTEAKKLSLRRRHMKASETDSMEMETARRSLEDKIAQLNATIDEVRQQLGSVNSNSGQVINERPLTKDT
ncbi:MAG: hypothetical protein KME28_05500 [Pelatocladus maniniholoensis HA4357-MV3]|uniref:Uncharacterized protein n=1 Tax=Pelatocladus maniniholoensis HA4357-MV3 TaxID=1117104 RepID=A0A9E3H5I7_9NOST|nr:hypothetical protein [Pelatocladus maniniholoensis HA4357-MV3]BAZ69623.1 hypothetical protein NIES4106_43960 [Fischerella sp. NIES-4106]